MSKKSKNPFNLWKELKRRNVFRVVVLYAGAAYVITEVVSNISEPLHLPGWVSTTVVLLLLAGFPVVAVLSWIFDITPEGLKKTGSADQDYISGEEPGPAKRKFKISDGIIAVLLVVVCILLYPKIFRKDTLEKLRDPDGRITLAVMPFENLTGDSSLDYWQRGIPEIMINDLGASDELLVASSLTMSEVQQSMGVSYAASILPNVARETADKLRAKIYINGKYQKSSDRLRIMVNIIDTEDGSIIWSDRVDGDPRADYLQLSDSISQIIKNYLEIESLKEKTDLEVHEGFAESSEAYRYYIEGVELLLTEDYELAAQQLEKALDIDSTFAMASFYMAWANLYGQAQDFDEVIKWLKKAYANREKLPTLYQNWLGVWYSMFISKIREDILSYCDLVAESDVRSRMILLDIGLTYKNFGFYEEAVLEFEKIMEINEEWGEPWKNPLFYKGSSRYYGKNAYHEAGKHKRENELYEIGISLFPDDADLYSCQAICALSRGDTVKGKRCIERTLVLLKENGETEFDLLNRQGNIYASAYLFDKAEKAYQHALDIEPDDFWTSYNLLEMYIFNDIKLTESMNMVQDLLDQDPDNIQLVKLKGIGKLKQGDYEEALELLKRWEEVYAFEESADPYIIEAEQVVARIKNQN